MSQLCQVQQCVDLPGTRVVVLYKWRQSFCHQVLLSMHVFRILDIYIAYCIKQSTGNYSEL